MRSSSSLDCGPKSDSQRPPAEVGMAIAQPTGQMPAPVGVSPLKFARCGGCFGAPLDTE